MTAALALLAYEDGSEDMSQPKGRGTCVGVEYDRNLVDFAHANVQRNHPELLKTDHVQFQVRNQNLSQPAP